MMSAHAARGANRSTYDSTRAHAILRFTFGVTLAFLICELLQWVPTFLAPIFVAVLLVNIPVRPPLKLGVGLIVIISAAAYIVLFLCTALLRSPTILFGVAALVVFRALYAIAAGRPKVAPLLLLICVTAIPVVALESLAIAGSFANALVWSMCLAIVVVWISYLLWPRVRPPAPAPKVIPLPQDFRLKSALLGTAILTPLMLVCFMFGLATSLPVLVATTMIVVNLDYQRGRMQAVALVAGNVAGGIVALVMFVLLSVHWSVLSLALVVALMALAYGWRISAGDPMASVYLVACNATLIVFSSSLLSGQGTFDVWLTRLTQFVIAGAFAVGTMTLIWPVRAPALPQAPEPTTN